MIAGGVGSARDAVGAATDSLSAAGCETPRLDAELLIADAMGLERGALLAHPEYEVPPTAARLIGERIRRRAMRVLRARLLERELAVQQAEEAAERRSQVGTGERSEKIRTYNFPQDRVTDHRVKVTKNGLARILDGELDEFTAALEAEEKRRKLEAGALVAG